MKLIRLSSLVVVAAAAVAMFSPAASAQQVDISVGGVFAPGVYGRINIGNAPPPIVIYPQPVLVVPPPPNVRLAPVYYNVPPGQAKKWYKHCYKYNACGVPVYFVRTQEYEGSRYREMGRGEQYEYEGKRGKKHGKGHDHDD